MARQTPTLAGNYHVQQTQSLHEALEQHYRRWGPNLIEEAEALARRILIDAGLPAEPDVLVPTETGITRGLRRLAIGHGHQPGSEVWYAAKVIEQVADVRRAIAEKDKDQILHDALHLGTLLMEWEVEHHWGRGIDLYSDRQTWAHGAAALIAGRQAAIDAAANALPASDFYPFPRRTVRNESLSTMCRGYPESADAPVLPTGPMPEIPTLALDGSLDVRTPVAWAQQAVAGNPNATLAVIPHTGHSTIGTDVSGCALDLAKRFPDYNGADGKCRQQPKPVPVAERPVSSVTQVKALAGNCHGLRGSKCTRAKKSITAGYQALRDAVNQFVVGSMYQGPGLYGGGWFLESDIADDFFTEIPVAIDAEGISQVPDVVADGKINIANYPDVSGSFEVLDFGGGSYRVELGGPGLSPARRSHNSDRRDAQERAPP